MRRTCEDDAFDSSFQDVNTARQNRKRYGELIFELLGIRG